MKIAFAQRHPSRDGGSGLPELLHACARAVRRLPAALGIAPVGDPVVEDADPLAGGALRGGVGPEVMARALAGLFAAGASLVLLTLLLPHDRGANEGALIAIIVDAYLVALVLARHRGQIAGWVLPVMLAWGTALITGVAYYSAIAPTPLVFFYLWVFLYAAYFFTRTQTLIQVGWAGIAYAALLTMRPPAVAPVSWWVVGMGTLTVAALLIGAMRARVERLIARLFDAARTDQLTKLLNRRGFRELLDLELERARRSGRPLSLLLADLDRFKLVNDRLGHQGGDDVLQQIADILRREARQIDAVARVGGEEFAVILPDTEVNGAAVFAERMREAVQAGLSSLSVPVTISSGVAGYGRDGETPGALLRSADEALYEAKERGRNVTVIRSRERPWRQRGDLLGRSVESERYLTVLLALAEAVDVRFSGSARHSETVGRYAELMARELGLGEHTIARVRLAGVLHDVGKVGIPNSILRKPGALSAREWSLVRRHPELGGQMLEHPGLEDLRGWVWAHHERPDGTGYPRGIPASDLSLEARILAVADAYEAMTSDRAYRSSLGAGAAREELLRCAPAQFDTDVVGAFLQALDRESSRLAERGPAPTAH